MLCAMPQTWRQMLEVVAIQCRAWQRPELHARRHCNRSDRQSNSLHDPDLGAYATGGQDIRFSYFIQSEVQRAAGWLYFACAGLKAWQGRVIHAESAALYSTHRSQPVLPICQAAVGQATAGPQQAVPADMLQPAQA